MRSLSAFLILAIACLCSCFETIRADDVNAPQGLQSIFNRDFCPKLKLYNGQRLEIGCFDSVLGFFPLTPRKINPTYSLYKGDDPSRCIRQWKWDEPLDHEQNATLSSDTRLALIVHGFRDQDTSDWMVDMKDALLSLDEPEKRAVITLDWSDGAEGPNYARAASNVFMLARVTAELLNRLTKRFNLDTDKMHLIGHSLGGQTVGHITKWLNEKYGIRVGRATGLDVAAPLFEERSIWPEKNDSKFLEGIHTSSGPSPVTGDFGLTVNFAHVDVYPNGGKAPQAGCPVPAALDLSCSHNLCRTLYTDFLRTCAAGCQFMGTLCKSVACAEDAACEERSLDLCNHTQTLTHEGSARHNQIIYFDTTAESYTNRCPQLTTTEATQTEANESSQNE